MRHRATWISTSVPAKNCKADTLFLMSDWVDLAEIQKRLKAIEDRKPSPFDGLTQVKARKSVLFQEPVDPSELLLPRSVGRGLLDNEVTGDISSLQSDVSSLDARVNNLEVPDTQIVALADEGGWSGWMPVIDIMHRPASLEVPLDPSSTYLVIGKCDWNFTASTGGYGMVIESDPGEYWQWGYIAGAAGRFPMTISHFVTGEDSIRLTFTRAYGTGIGQVGVGFTQLHTMRIGG